MPATATQPEQPELFAVDTLAGFGELAVKEQVFVTALFEGCKQREAAERAGFTGSPEVLDVAGSKMVRRPKVQALMAQAWARSGATISDTLRQAAELQRRAFHEAVNADSAVGRKAAFGQWREASALIASIHGKLSLNVQHRHSGQISIVSDEDRAHLMEIQRAGVVFAPAPVNQGGRN